MHADVVDGAERIGRARPPVPAAATLVSGAETRCDWITLGAAVGFPPEAGGVAVCVVGTADDENAGTVQGEIPEEARTSSQMIGTPEGEGSAGELGDQRPVM